MTKPHAADDFAAIAKRRRELFPEAGSPEPYPVCVTCEGGGWVLSGFQARHPPNFDECPECGNTAEHPSP